MLDSTTLSKGGIFSPVVTEPVMPIEDKILIKKTKKQLRQEYAYNDQVLDP